MNNLKFFRELSKTSAKKIALLLNVSVYTYYGLEKERMIIDDVLREMIGKIYNIFPEDLFCEKDNISGETIANIKKMSLLSESAKHDLMIYNLIGKRKEITYKDISEIKKKLRDSINENL